MLPPSLDVSILTWAVCIRERPFSISMRLYVPSLDRIVAGRGYTTDNARIVLLAVNVMLSDWGADVFEQVANSYRYWQRG